LRTSIGWKAAGRWLEGSWKALDGGWKAAGISLLERGSKVAGRWLEGGWEAAGASSKVYFRLDFSTK